MQFPAGNKQGCKTWQMQSYNDILATLVIKSALVVTMLLPWFYHAGNEFVDCVKKVTLAMKKQKQKQYGNSIHGNAFAARLRTPEGSRTLKPVAEELPV